MVARGVSVIIPTRNRVVLLARTLAAVLAQRDVDLEVIVVDEGSTDGTEAFLAQLDDQRVVVVRNMPPLGVAAARNCGLERATMPWVAFDDDDDVWAPDKLASQLDALTADGVARWSAVGAVVVDETGAFVRPDLPPDRRDVLSLVLTDNQIPAGGSGVLAATDLVREVGGFDTSLRNLADWDLWISLARRSPLAVVDRPLVAYLQHRRSMSHGVSDAEDEFAHIHAKHRDAYEQRGLEPRLDLAWSWITEMELRAGRRRPVLRLQAKTFRRYRHWSWVAMTAVGIAWPGAIRLKDTWARRRSPDGWFEEAQEWLAMVPATPPPARAQGPARAPDPAPTPNPAPTSS